MMQSQKSSSAARKVTMPMTLNPVHIMLGLHMSKPTPAAAQCYCEAGTRTADGGEKRPRATHL